MKHTCAKHLALKTSGLENLNVSLNTVLLSSNKSPFTFPPTSNDPLGSGAIFPNTEAEPSIAVGPNPTGSALPMVVVCHQQDRFNHNGGCCADYMHISLDGGSTFGAPIALPNVSCFGGAYERTSDPHVAISSNGTILFAGLPFDVVNDGNSGVSVSQYDVLNKKFNYIKDIDPQKGPISNSKNTGSDYPTLVVDPQDQSGNTAYMGWTRYWAVNANKGYYQSNLGFSKTTDGQIWTVPINYATTPDLDLSLGPDTSIGVNQFVLLNNPNKPYSKIVALFNDTVGFDYGAVNQYNLIYSTYSLDQGVTWSTPLLFDMRSNSGSGQTVSQIVDPDDYTKFVRGGDGNPHSASDRKNNRVYAVAVLDSLLNLVNPAPSGLYLFASSDGAQTWKPVGKINKDKTIQTKINNDLTVQAFNPSITVLDNGNVAVSYYDFRNHSFNPDMTKSLETDRWLDIFSYDPIQNAVSLVNEIRLTKKSFNFRNAIQLIGGHQTPAGYFLGDYTGMQYYNGSIYNSYGTTGDVVNSTLLWSNTVKL